MTLFCDMDGVLADFDTHYEDIFGTRPDKTADNVDWEAVRHVKNFYANIPPMPDMKRLWSYIGPYQPVILTGIPSSVPEARSNKEGWIRKNIGNSVRVVCCPSKSKCDYAQKGDILIDDWEKYKDKWTAKGGVWITHTGAENTIKKLKNLGF